jgi:hypothetical protein
MSDDEDDILDDEDDDGLVSAGKIADHHSIVDANFAAPLRKKFEIYSYRNAANILSNSFPEQFADITAAMTNMAVTKEMIRMPGGSKGPIAKHVDTLFSDDDWVETRISADLHVQLLHAKRTKNQPVIKQYTREGFLDGHRIDFVRGRVALDLEWNSKDQTYDRDLYAMSAFYDAGAIDVGVIITRGFSLDGAFFRSLGKVLKKDGTEGTSDVYKKYGASTTWMGKLLYRLDAGRNGGCPVLAIGITPDGIV